VLPDETSTALPLVGAAGPASSFESQTLDFKRPGRSLKETLTMLAEAAVCFANADGGCIVLGVDDRATSRSEALVGVGTSLTLDLVRRGIFDRTVPPLTVFAEEHIEDDARLIVIRVPTGVQILATTDGKSTRRLGTECRPFPPNQQREVLVARGQLDWSAELSDATIEAVAPTELERLRAHLRRAGHEELAELRRARLLEALRLTGESGRLTHAGLLLLGDEDIIARHVPQYGYSYQFRPTAGSEATSRGRGRRPLLAAAELLLEAVSVRSEERPLNLAGGVQVSLVDYPERAVRELVINGLIHRSFQTEGTVDIEHSPESLAITSPGCLVAGVTRENILTHPSTPRNRLLAEVVSMCRLAERTGQGIDRAYREMLSAGKEPPRIEDNGLHVRALLAGGIGNDAFVRFVRSLPDALARDLDVLLVLALLRNRSSIDAPRLATVNQRPAAESQQVLSRLADEQIGLLEPTRRTVRKAFPSYRLRNAALAELARAVTYRRRTLDGTDAKVVEHIDEYGFVTNKTLQRLFDVQIYTARNMLADLQARGIVEKIGEARGGPGVRYGPGPGFPGRRRRAKPIR